MNPFCPECGAIMFTKMRNVVLRTELDEEKTKELFEKHSKECPYKKKKQKCECDVEEVYRKFYGLRRYWECSNCGYRVRKGDAIIKRGKPLSEKELEERMPKELPKIGRRHRRIRRLQ